MISDPQHLEISPDVQKTCLEEKMRVSKADAIKMTPEAYRERCASAIEATRKYISGVKEAAKKFGCRTSKPSDGGSVR